MLGLSETVEVQLIVGITAIVVSLVTGTLAIIAARSANKAALKTKDEITNKHPLNIRDDLDAKFAEMAKQFELMAKRQDRTETKIDTLAEREAGARLIQDRSHVALEERVTAMEGRCIQVHGEPKKV